MNTGLDTEKLLDFMKELAVRCGKIAESSRYNVNESDLESKETKFDLVTMVDKQLEDLIIQEITRRYPEHGILGEETGLHNSSSPFLWIIDPIDGTTSFVHHAPNYCISIGLHFENKPFAGVVYAPVFNELFYAAAGKGAFCNGRRIHVSDHKELNHALACTGFSCLRAGWKCNNLTYFNRIAPLVRDIRRYGSAAIDCCWVACGRHDFFWELNLKKHDYGAGEVIVMEAGGSSTDLFGGHDMPEKGTLMCNGHLLPVLLPFFEDYKAIRK